MGNLWKLPEEDADSLSDPFPGFGVRGSQGEGRELPLGGWRVREEGEGN